MVETYKIRQINDKPDINCWSNRLNLAFNHAGSPCESTEAHYLSAFVTMTSQIKFRDFHNVSVELENLLRPIIVKLAGVTPLAAFHVGTHLKCHKHDYLSVPKPSTDLQDLFRADQIVARPPTSICRLQWSTVVQSTVHVGSPNR